MVCTCGTGRLSAQSVEGFAEPIEFVRVAAPEAGIVRSNLVSQGEAVRAGQAIASLDTEVLLASLELARAKAASLGELQAAEAALRLRERRVQQMDSLIAQGHASPEETARAHTDLAIAAASLLAAKEEQRLRQLEVQQIEAQIERRTIHSPIDGIVIQLHKCPGEFVAVNDSGIATVVQLSALRVKFFPSTRQAAQLAARQTVEILFPESGQSTTGAVDFVSPVTDSDSGTVRVEVVIDNQEGMYRSGTRCQLHTPSERVSTAALPGSYGLNFPAATKQQGEHLP
jgi:RND family efflux transporter MFP subunit